MILFLHPLSQSLDALLDVGQLALAVGALCADLLHQSGGGTLHELGVGQLVLKHGQFLLGLGLFLVQAGQLLLAVDQLHHGDKAAGGVGGHLHHAIGAALVLFRKGHVGGKGKLCQIDLCIPEGSGISRLDDHTGLFGRMDIHLGAHGADCLDVVHDLFKGFLFLGQLCASSKVGQLWVIMVSAEPGRA